MSYFRKLLMLALALQVLGHGRCHDSPHGLKAVRV